MQQISNYTKTEGNNMSAAKETLAGLSTGFGSLDKVLDGLRSSQLVVVSGVPGIGKTAFVLSMLFRMSGQYNTKVGYFTCETSASNIADRLMAYVRCKPQVPSDSTSMNRNFQDIPLYVEDKIFTYEELKESIEKACFERQLNCVCIDSLQYLSVSERSCMPKGNSDLHYIVYELKKLARRLEISIVITSQMVDPWIHGWEGPEVYRTHWMEQSDDDNACSESADIFLQVVRPEYFFIYEDEKGYDQRGLMYIYIRKNRNGQLGEIKLRYYSQSAILKEIGENGEIVDNLFIYNK